MDSNEGTKPEKSQCGRSIPVKTVGLILGSAVLGAMVTAFVLRALQGGVETLSTAGLLGLLFITGLSVSAIALAIIAISFSRTAERTMERKAQEMSAMQTAMLMQAAAAIDRMESAFARIGKGTAEDFTAVQQPKKQKQERPVSEPGLADEREKAEKKYGGFKDIVLLGVANYPGVVARKIGDGQYRAGDDELVDGTFIINNEKVAVCTFCTNDSLTGRFTGENGVRFNVFLRSLVNELKDGRFTRVFMVFDGKLSDASLYTKALNELNGQIDEETFACFELFEGSPDVIIPELTERVSQLMDAAREPGAEEEDIPPGAVRRPIKES